ncbi:hypothetical protein QMZ92_35255 [Streptomyces sp. HNM0645]|uniref:hypothetical protein n=1 Tax=Streptomyces sp. HNM0645 TaxID=2782343 RepID=UPI0024B86C6A|nr:hypothetical protein [Streptomyces sp. HNM0645]MDI9889426.1 hypothetical protein [Streptomyces sp. HNM0645]
MKVSSTSRLCALAALGLVVSAPSAYGNAERDQGRQKVEVITVISRTAGGSFPNSTADLFDEKGNQVGFSTTNCTVITDPRTVSCYGAYVLEGRGQITWQNATRNESTPFLTAITGGTGRYCEARGQIRVIRTQSDPQGGLSQLKVFKGQKCPDSA